MTTPPKTNVPERYAKALDTADPLTVLRKTPKRLRKLLRDAKERELAWKPDAATWSVHEIVGHLADNEFVLGARVRFVAAEERPLLPAYDEKRFVAALGLERASLEDLFDAWVAARAANVHLFDRLAQESWTRIGLHAERGEISLLQILIGAAGHDRVHEEQIERTIARCRAARREEKERERAEGKARKAAKSAKKQQGGESTAKGPEPASARKSGGRTRAVAKAEAKAARTAVTS